MTIPPDSEWYSIIDYYPVFEVMSITNDTTCLFRNRSQVQGSTFRVKDKEGIEDPKSSIKMFIFPSNCQFGSKSWIRPDETDAFFVNTHPKCSPWTRMEPLNP